MVIRVALNYLRNDREQVGTTVLLGGILTFFSFLVVPQIVVLGYIVRVLRRTSRGDEAPPSFDDWLDLLVVGAKAYVIWLGWTVIPLLVRFGLSGGHLDPGQATFWLLGWMLSPNLISLAQRGTRTTGVLEGFGFTEPYVDLLIVLYILPAALANYADKGTIRSGFFEGGLRRYLDWVFGVIEHVLPDVAATAKRLLDRVLPEPEFEPVSTLTTWRYAVNWAKYFLLYVTAEAILQLTVYIPTFDGRLILPIAGYLFVALLGHFYLRVAAWSIIGRAWPSVRPSNGEQAIPEDPPLVDVRREPSSTTGSREGVTAIPLKIVFIGGLLMGFGAYFLLPWVVLTGYLVRILRSELRGEELPLFGGLTDLFVDGLKTYVIWFGYTLVPVTLLAVSAFGTLEEVSVLDTLAVWSVVTGIGLPGGFPAALLSFLGTFVMIYLLQAAITAPLPSILLPLLVIVVRFPLPISIPFFVLTVYAVPAALLRFAETGSLRSGFALRAILPILGTTSYAARWATMMGLTTIGWAVLVGGNVLMIEALFSGLTLSEPIAGLEYLTFFSGPTTVRALLIWVIVLLAGIVYFALLIVSCRILGRTGAIRRRSADCVSPRTGH